MENATKTVSAAAQKMTVWSILGLIIGVGLAIYIVTFIISYLVEQRRLVSNPENNARIKALALAELEERYLGRSRSTYSSGPMTRLAEPQQLLINADVFSCRYAGYLGPLEHGIYSEDDAVRIACDAGVRLFVVEVGMMKDHVTPTLVARNSAGAHVGNTYGSIKAVVDALGRYAFRDGRSDPLLVYIHAHSAPNQATEPKNYFAFCSALASQLGGLDTYRLTNSSRGSYGRQGLENSVFYTPIKEFSNSAIIMTNLDTTCFRKPADYGLEPVKPAHDLDSMIHVRVYGETDKSEKKPAAYAVSPSYLTATPDSMIADAQKKTKESFTIVLDDGMSSLDYKNMREMYGVQAVAYAMFAEDIDSMIGQGSPHYKDSWIGKADGLRYIPAEPIAVTKADSRTDANQGVFNAIKL